MLRYEDARTKQIVNRLVAMGNTLRMFMIIFWAVVFGAVFSATTALVAGQVWWVGAILGLLFGFVSGMYLASLVMVILEWAAQMLIAQGELIAALQSKS